jgi:hypothetical protein
VAYLGGGGSPCPFCPTGKEYKGPPGANKSSSNLDSLLPGSISQSVVLQLLIESPFHGTPNSSTERLVDISMLSLIDLSTSAFELTARSERSREFRLLGLR